MTDYDPADYATEADGYSIDLYCRPCRNTGNYNEQWVHYWNENETADLAAQDTAAREHHQQYHAPPQCGAVSSPHLGGDQCDDVPDHYGVHTHLRTWWENHDYPAGVGPCTTDRCTKYNGHPGDHHQRPEPGPSPYSEEPPW